ncbi:hypothetical protein [Telmatospirillum sp. J64-1]|uniref:hypothetical protein n=1 Tax=Telmatospirillum sp. J64-1 TaxID=2502183 RepID=UPI00115D5FE8|nr:hypothetical protein [Telmatospirillum sp. J64-1]
MKAFATFAVSLFMLAASPLAVQAQEGEMQAAQPQAGQQQTGQQNGTFDIVAGDRDTAWRINRQTGEVMVCRVNPVAVDTVSALCAPAQQVAGAAPELGGMGGLGGEEAAEGGPPQ